MITSQDKNDSEAINKAQTFQENHNNSEMIEEEPIDEKFKQKIKIDIDTKQKRKNLKKSNTIQKNQKFTLSRFGEQIEQQKDNKKEEIQQIKTKIRKNGKKKVELKVKFIDEIEHKTPLKEQINITSFKKFNQIKIPQHDNKLIIASNFVNDVILKQEYYADIYRDCNINKKALIENKPKIGFWQGIFCCCSADVIRRRQTSVVIDKIIERHPDNKNNNILLNTDEINAINRDIQTYMRD